MLVPIWIGVYARNIGCLSCLRRENTWGPHRFSFPTMERAAREQRTTDCLVTFLHCVLTISQATLVRQYWKTCNLAQYIPIQDRIKRAADRLHTHAKLTVLKVLKERNEILSRPPCSQKEVHATDGVVPCCLEQRTPRVHERGGILETGPSLAPADMRQIPCNLRVQFTQCRPVSDLEN